MNGSLPGINNKHFSLTHNVLGARCGGSDEGDPRRAEGPALWTLCKLMHGIASSRATSSQHICNIAAGKSCLGPLDRLQGSDERLE